MLVIIVVFGAVSALALFITSVMLFVAGQFWLGFGLLLSILYIVALTVILIRLDGSVTETHNAIVKLGRDMEIIKRTLNITEPEVGEENAVEYGGRQAEGGEQGVGDPEIVMDGVRFCKVCGYQLFPENKICPMCGVDTDSDDSAMG